MGESVLDLNTLAKLLTSLPRLLESTEAFLKSFIVCDRNGSSPTGSGVRASGSLWTGATDFRIEFDGGSWLERFDLSFRTRDGLGAKVDLEVEFGEHPRRPCAHAPRFRANVAPCFEDVIDYGTIDVGPVDVQFDERETLSLDVNADLRDPLVCLLHSAC
jgi:hypothetical protein